MSSVNTQSDKNVMHDLLKRTYIIRSVFQLELTHFFRKFIFRYLKNIYLFNKIPFLEYLVLVDVTQWFYRTSLKLLCRSRVKLQQHLIKQKLVDLKFKLKGDVTAVQTSQMIYAII